MCATHRPQCTDAPWGFPDRFLWSSAEIDSIDTVLRASLPSIYSVPHSALHDEPGATPG